MKIKNIIIGSALMATFGGMMLTSCEESELYSADAPEWISDSVSAVAARNAANAGEAAFNAETVTSDAWWTAWSKNYSFAENQRMTIEITLDKSTREKRWKNFAMVVATSGWEFPSSGEKPNDVEGYGEYFVVRGDAGNWNGKGNVVVTPDAALDLSNENFVSFQEDGSKFTIIAEHYPTGSILINSTQVTPSGDEYHWSAVGTAEAGKACQIFFAGEGSTFTITNITYETLEELKPTKLEVTGTPTAVSFTEEEVKPSYYYGDGVATVTWSNGSTSTVGIDELTFSVVPDLKTIGTALVTVAYAKTSMGQFCEPVSTGYKIEVAGEIESIKINPVSETPTYYYVPGTTEIKKEDIDITKFIKSVVGISGSVELPLSSSAYTTEVTVPSTIADGEKIVIKVTYKDFSASLEVTLKQMQSENVSLSGTSIGTEDYKIAFCTEFSESVKIESGSGKIFTFTNKSDKDARDNGNRINFKNFIVILTNDAEHTLWGDKCYGVMRADYAAWGHNANNVADWNWVNSLFDTWNVEANWVWDGDETHAAMQDAISDSKVTVEVINKGTVVDVKCTIVSNVDNNTYFQNYLNIPINGDVYATISCEGAYLVFE